MEIDAQAATLDEQRNHIGVLDKALSNAQDRLSKRERVSSLLMFLLLNCILLVNFGDLIVFRYCNNC